MILSRILPIVIGLASSVAAFQPASVTSIGVRSSSALFQTADDQNDGRRSFITRTSGAIFAGIFTSSLSKVEESGAVVYLDPAMYGDQETRLSAVDSLKEAIRRSILQNPQLAPIYYSMAVLEGLSYDPKSGDYGPDGRIVFAILESKDDSEYMKLMKEAAKTIVESKKSLKKLTSITIADGVALGGSGAIESVGGPNLSIQVGRTDGASGLKFNPNLPLDLFSGSHSISEVRAAFSNAGLTEREMVALLGCLLTLNAVDKDGDAKNWAKSEKQGFRERGKMGRMSEFKKLTDEDIEKALSSEFDDEDDEPGLFDDQPYIADTFGTRDQAFGKKAGGLTDKNFNKYLQELYTFRNGKGGGKQPFGWIGDLIVDDKSPGAQIWLGKYSQSYLNYQKDLGVAFNSITQLGGEFTGGKYENLLKNKPRRTLNDDY